MPSIHPYSDTDLRWYTGRGRAEIYGYYGTSGHMFCKVYRTTAQAPPDVGFRYVYLRSLYSNQGYMLSQTLEGVTSMEEAQKAVQVYYFLTKEQVLRVSDKMDQIREMDNARGLKLKGESP